MIHFCGGRGVSENNKIIADTIIKERAQFLYCAQLNI